MEWGHASGIEATLSADERAAVRAKLEANGLEISCVATGVQMANPDPEAQKQHIADLKTYVDLAADLGAKYVRTFGGPQAGRGTDLRPAIEYTVKGYMQVLPQAAARGVVVLLETHDDWSNTPAVRAVIEQANHPNLACLWDCMHPQREMEKVSESWRNIGKHTRHVHTHDSVYDDDGKLTAVPMGQGIFDYATPYQLLQDEGWDGHFSIEVIHKVGTGSGAGGSGEQVLAQYASEFAKIARLSGGQASRL